MDTPPAQTITANPAAAAARNQTDTSSACQLCSSTASAEAKPKTTDSMTAAMSIAKKSKASPSVFLMPMAFASLLGGLTTLVGTSPNIIVSAMREELTGEPFAMFDYTPVGLALMIAGLAFLAVGYRLLPTGQTPATVNPSPRDIAWQQRLTGGDEHQTACRTRHKEAHQRPPAADRLKPECGQRISGDLGQGQQHQKPVSAHEAVALRHEPARQPDENAVIS